MSFFKNLGKNIVKVGKKIGSTCKDVGTSAVRIVTDTAIDIGDTVTGFKFSKDMDNAKKTMSKAGIKKASEAIEDNHYAFLKTMQADAEKKNDELVRLCQQGKDRCAVLNNSNDKFVNMEHQLRLLSAMAEEYKSLLKEHECYPSWIDKGQSCNIKIISQFNNGDNFAKWQKVSDLMIKSGLITIGADALIGIGGIAAAVRAAQLSKLFRVASAAKFTKFSSIAGKASVALTVVVIGLDIGLSVVELEKRKDKLKQYLREVDKEISHANKDISDLQDKISLVDQLIEKLFDAAEVRGLPEWENWFKQQSDEITEASTVMISLSGAITRAECLVKHCINKYSHAELLEYVKNVEPQLSDDMINEIIEIIKKK